MALPALLKGSNAAAVAAGTSCGPARPEGASLSSFDTCCMIGKGLAEVWVCWTDSQHGVFEHAARQLEA